MSSLLVGEYVAFAILFLLLFNILMLLLWLNQRRKIRGLEKRYRNLLAGNREFSLEEILNSYVLKTMQNEENLNTISYRLDNFEHENQKNVSGIGLIRYNAFKETGGDLSFSVAFLNSRKQGVVLTGISGREETRVYAKDLDNGKSRYLLSEEEIQAMEVALTGNGKKREINEKKRR